jgi:hypothetical protein
MFISHDEGDETNHHCLQIYPAKVESEHSSLKIDDLAKQEEPIMSNMHRQGHLSYARHNKQINFINKAS